MKVRSKQENIELLSHNQNTFNQELANDHKFCQVSMPMCVRVWNRLIAHDLVSVQPWGDTSEVHYMKGDRSFGKYDVAHADRKLKCLLSYEGVPQEAKWVIAENELLAIMTQEITMELNQQLTHFIRREAKTKKIFDLNNLLFGEKAKNIHEMIEEVSEEINDKIGSHANWIVASPEVCYTLERSPSFNLASEFNAFGLDVQCKGTLLRKYKLYSNPLLPAQSLVMGFKGEHPYDAGIVYSPKTLLKPTITNTSNGFARGIMTCDSLTFVPDGQDFYASVTLNNFMY